MDEKININTDDLKIISNNIITKKNQIIDIYNHRIKTIINDNEKFLMENGFTIDEIEELFTKLDKDITELVNVLKNRIIGNYEDLNTNLKDLFSNKFKNEIESLLDIKNND